MGLRILKITVATPIEPCFSRPNVIYNLGNPSLSNLPRLNLGHVAMELNSIRIHQIYYAEPQKAGLDPDFVPYDNSGSSNGRKWCEYDVFKCVFAKEVSNGLARNQYVGCLSWKFYQKTHLTGKSWIQWMQSQPGFDVYFINPFRDLYTSQYQNVWYQGETRHPGLLDFTQGLFDKLDYKIQLRELINNSDEMAYCNYWVGNERFWKRYMAFCEPLYNYCQNSLSISEEKFLQETLNSSGIPLLPYIVERMFSTFLAIGRDREDFKVSFCSYPVSDPVSDEFVRIKELKLETIAGRTQPDFALLNGLIFQIERIDMARDRLEVEHNRLSMRLARRSVNYITSVPFVRYLSRLAIVSIRKTLGDRSPS